MGISGLLPLLKSVTHKVHIESLAGQSVAIDAYSWLHKGVFSCVEDLYHQRPTQRYVDYCLNRLRQLVRFKVNPIMVFDGGPLPMKAYRENERATRREESRNKAEEFLAKGDSDTPGKRRVMSTMARTHMSKSADVTPEMAYTLITALRREGIQFIVAPYEADAQMAYLDRIGEVAAIISEDSDLLLFGCRRVLFKMDRSGWAEEICLDRLGACEELDLREFTLKRFRQMCILSGCDYLPPLGGLGIKTLHKYFKVHRSIDRVLYALRREANKLIDSAFEREFVKAELTFQHQRVYCPKAKQLVHLNPWPKTLDLELDVQIEDEGTDFVGPDLGPELARGIAEGHLNPITGLSFTAAEAKKPPTVLAQLQRQERAISFPAVIAASESQMPRLSIKRALSTHAISDVQASLRSKFAKTVPATSLVDHSIPKYVLLAKPQLQKRAKGAIQHDSKQFSILNFCLPKPGPFEEGE